MLTCFDCKRTLKKNEDFVEYPVNITSAPEKRFVKCKRCHKKDSTLRNFMKTKVYSRIVGYFSDTDMWNPGKKSEWKDRKTFKLKKK